MSQKQIHFTASGRVQGVFFRANTQDLAKSYGLTGWVRNLQNGNVEGVAEGEEVELKRFIEELEESPGASKVDELQVEWKPSKGEFQEFKIVY